MVDPRQFHSQMQQVDDLLRDAERTADPATQSLLQELTSALLEVHRLALQRMLEHLTAAGAAGADILKTCAGDDVISPLLVLHGLHPIDVETRVRAALEKVRPYLASHGGHVELLSITPDGAVNLRLEGSCHGCPSSRVTLQTSIEAEIAAAAPEVTSIVVEGLVEPPPPQIPAHPTGFVPVELLAINGNAQPAVAAAS
jgi:Fe-S cluster biogenesis protein NfuA